MTTAERDALGREARKPTPGTERRLWFGILAGPTAWTVNEMVGVAVIGRRCPGETVLAWQWTVLIAVSAVCVLATAAAGLGAYRVFRAWSGPASLANTDGWGRVEFMAAFGALISGFLLLSIVYFAVLPLFVDPCLVVT